MEQFTAWMADKLTPETGGVVTIGSFVTGEGIGQVSEPVQHAILFYAQLAAFAVSVLVGIATLYVLHLKICRHKNKPTDED